MKSFWMKTCAYCHNELSDLEVDLLPVDPYSLYRCNRCKQLVENRNEIAVGDGGNEHEED